MAALSPFVLDKLYQPLSHDSSEIRLLELESGDFDDDLIGTLRVVSLETTPEYDALSYVWGQELCSRSAFVDGQCLTVGLSLDLALRHIRDKIVRGQVRILWVDAVCINQANITERNQQVRLMKEVYSTAKAVLIWLGPSQPGEDLILDNVEQQQEEIPKTRSDWQLLFDALMQICQRPWFGRVWIVQELILAQRDPEIWIGDRVVSWSKFFGYLDSIHANADLIPSWPFEDASVIFKQAIRTADGLRKLRRVWSRKQSRSLSYNLQITKGCKATDPRDRIFGLLGISELPRSGPTITPDYSLSVAEVYARTTLSLMQTQECPHFFFALPSMSAGHSAQRENPYRLPSWVCDYTTDSQHPSSIHKAYPFRLTPAGTDPPSLCGDLKEIGPYARSSKHWSILTVIGKVIGKIVDTTNSKRNADQSVEWLNQSLLERVFSEMNSTRLVKYVRTSTPGDDSGALPRHSRAHPVLDRADGVMFVLDTGSIGATYHPDPVNGVRPGDMVVGLFGINYPFILRPISGINGQDSHNYTMINVAYIIDHVYEHDFVRDSIKRSENGTARLRWSDFAVHGMEEFTIV